MTRIFAAFQANHNGDLALARRLIDAARKAGADGVVFQKRTVRLAAVRQILERPVAPYSAFGPTYRKALERLELPVESCALLCREAQGLQVFLAPYDLEAFHQMEGLPLTGWKVDAPLATHLPLLEVMGASGKPIIASVAGCTQTEVQELVKRLPRECTLLHELKGSQTLAGIQDLVPLMALKDFGHPVGYAGNSLDFSLDLTAVALGAMVLEKPLTLDRNLPGPHHGASLLPQELEGFVRKVRALESLIQRKALRDPCPEEMDLLDWNRVSIVAACPIPRGTRITREMLTLKAPFQALSPSFLPFLEGRRVLYDIPEDELLTLGMVEL